MNYLAHLFFALDNTESRIGNLLGDFCRGVDVKSLPDTVQQGLRQHRAVDAFTDRSAEVLAAKQYFSAHRRRFAGIAIDMLFDHFLIRHWSKFHPQPFDLYKQQLYQKLQTDLPQMPASMQPTVSAIIRQDWFVSYAEIQYLGLALDRVAQRIRFANQFAGAGLDIQAHYPELEQLFLKFFPRLQQHVQQQNW
jgi:acyl carrier protein phosphodiesterase